jgi:hypothetical protein
MSIEKATKWRSRDSVLLQLLSDLNRRVSVPAIEKRWHLFDGPLEEGVEGREEKVSGFPSRSWYEDEMER